MYVAESGNTLQIGGEVQEPRVVFTSDGKRNEEIDARICKATQLHAGFNALSGHKTGAFKHRKTLSF